MVSDIVFEEDPPRRAQGEAGAGEPESRVLSTDSLLLNIDGYEGPIDILLAMARDQKVDLKKVSILQLARQYLDFIDRASQLQLDLAAEYLVIAAWLAYLKSRLLLPAQENENEPSAEDMAEALQFQLRRLEAMQDATGKLFDLPQLGQGIYARGMPEGLAVRFDTRYEAGFYDLLKAYGDIERRKQADNYELPTFQLMTMEAALERMSRMLGKLPRKGPWSVWTTLHSFVPDQNFDQNADQGKNRLYVRSSLASLLTVGLEMAKQGKVEIKQDGPFRPVYLRAALEKLHDETDSNRKDEEHD